MIGEYRRSARLEQPGSHDARRMTFAISRARAARATHGARASFPCGATSCSTPRRRSRRSPSCATDRSRSCSSRRRPAARRGRATRSWAPRRAPRGSSTTASFRTGRRSAAGTTTGAPPIRSPISRRCCDDCEPVDVPEIGEFWSGAVGYFGYDVARVIERLPAPPARGVDVPDALFVFTDALVIFDNLRSQARVVAAARVERRRADDAARRGVRRGDAHGRRDDRAPPRPVACSRRSTSTPSAPPAEGTSTLREREVSRRRRAHSRVHHRRRRVPGAARAPHRRAVRLLVDAISIARCG